MTKILQDVNVGKNLQKIRKARNLTQNDVCIQMQMSGRPMIQSTYAQIESGSRNIFASDLIALKTILNTTYDEIFQDLQPVNKQQK